MTYAANCPCGKGLIVVPSQSPSLARGSSSPSLARGLLWPSSMDASSLAYSPSTYTTSWCTRCTCLWRHTCLWRCTCRLRRTRRTLDLSILAPLVAVWRGMVIVASRERQHEHLIVAWESLRSSLAFVVLPSSLLAIRHRNDCRVVDIVSWRRGQFYRWRFTPSRSSMWLVHINERVVRHLGDLTCSSRLTVVAFVVASCDSA
jgi:hypothetical protein